MAKPVKRKTVSGGRVTPKDSKSAVPTPTGRYTPPIPREVKVSPTWVPVLMFVLLGLGILVILLNYVDVIPDFLPTADGTSNVYLLIGLGFILGGIIVATQYH
ncbi:MAG: cell division protein CrgA [Acidimicrobiales bacterium]